MANVYIGVNGIINIGKESKNMQEQILKYFETKEFKEINESGLFYVEIDRLRSSDYHDALANALTVDPRNCLFRAKFIKCITETDPYIFIFQISEISKDTRCKFVIQSSDLKNIRFGNGVYSEEEDKLYTVHLLLRPTTYNIQG